MICIEQGNESREREIETTAAVNGGEFFRFWIKLKNETWLTSRTGGELEPNG